ncbi:MAG: glycosyltransferase family 87 protein [Pyrinomonadaceae bacterium]
MKRALRIALAIVAVALLGIVFVRYNSFIDFPVYYLSGRSLIAGRTNLYAPEFSGGPLLNYRYPPFFIVVFGFLGFLPYLWAAYIWYWVCVVSIAGCIFTVRTSVKEWQGSIGIGPQGHAVWIIALLAVGQYFVLALHAGNAHLLVVFLLFYSLHFALRREDGWAALLMSLAITIKFFPILMLPYFAIKQRWKLLALVGLFLIVINLLPAGYFGFRRNVELLKDWYGEVVVIQEPREKNAQINISLKGELRRTFTHVDYSTRGRGTESTDTDYPSVNIASVPQVTSDRVWIALSAALGLMACVVIWKASGSFSRTDHVTMNGSTVRRKQDSTQLRLKEPIEYSLIICLILIVGPFTAKMYFMILLWPVTFLASFAMKRTDPVARISKYVLLFIAAANVVLPLIPGRDLQRWLLVIGTDFYLTVLLMLALILTLVSGQSDHPAQVWQ